MAKFLNAAATMYHLEELVKQARTRLILISPDLKFSGRTKELLEEKNGVDVRVVYGQNDLPPEEINWLRGLAFVRTNFCRNLRAKCYLNDDLCIVTSLSLYDFSQITNNEMGVLMSRADDSELYRDACTEAEHIIRISDEVRISVDKVERVGGVVATNGNAGKVSTSRLAKKLGLKTQELLDGLERLGAIELAAGGKQLTPRGVRLGGEFRSSAKFGDYFVWPENFELGEVAANGR
jgi:hypothetical protein